MIRRVGDVWLCYLSIIHWYNSPRSDVTWSLIWDQYDLKKSSMLQTHWSNRIYLYIVCGLTLYYTIFEFNNPVLFILSSNNLPHVDHIFFMCDKCFSFGQVWNIALWYDKESTSPDIEIVVGTLQKCSRKDVNSMHQHGCPSVRHPARVAQWWALRTHDLVVVSLIPGWGNFSFWHIFASHLYRSMWEK